MSDSNYLEKWEKKKKKKEREEGESRGKRQGCCTKFRVATNSTNVFFQFFEHLKVTFEKLNHSLGAQVSCHNIIHSFLMTLTSYSIRIQLHKLGKAASSFLSLSLRFQRPDPFYLQGDNFLLSLSPLFSPMCNVVRIIYIFVTSRCSRVRDNICRMRTIEEHYLVFFTFFRNSSVIVASYLGIIVHTKAVLSMNGSHHKST